MKEKEKREEEKKIFPISKKMAQEMIEIINEEANFRKREGTVGDKGGDAYHDEVFLSSEREFYRLKAEAGRLRLLVEGKEELLAPESNEEIQLGHRVKFYWIEDNTSELIVAHLVSETDSLILGKKTFIGETGKKIISKLEKNKEIALSAASPVGRALVGKRRGEKIPYNPGEGKQTNLLISKEPEAITVSWLLESQL
jgi:hypothetical protein